MGFSVEFGGKVNFTIHYSCTRLLFMAVSQKANNALSPLFGYLRRFDPHIYIYIYSFIYGQKYIVSFGGSIG